MLKIKSARFKNFFSFGNFWTEIRFDQEPVTLISGSNGSGKSSAILDSICFGLFGKPFRNINKPDVINSINGTECVVEIEFSTSKSKNYLIRRGLKPNIFEIWQNGKEIEQTAAIKDYQKFLEQQILRLNYKTFVQVVILGSASYVPFMQLPSHVRREVIEDILDIRIFSIMNSLLKNHILETRDKISNIDSTVTLMKAKVESQKRLIQTIVTHKQENIQNVLEKINANSLELHQIQTQINEYVTQINAYSSEIDSSVDLKAELKRAETTKTEINQRAKSLKKKSKFFETQDICPECEQSIQVEHKHRIVTDVNTKLKADEDNFILYSERVEKIEKEFEKLQQVNKKINGLNVEIEKLNNRNSILNDLNRKFQLEINSSKADTSNLDEEKKTLKDLANKALALLDEKNILAEQRALQEVGSILLKDTGIKTAIIREYLPVINKLINGYLTAMDFFVKFELDEAFNEKIKSRHREEFSYESFSQGQKMRIDIAILFTWRQIAKMKNSVNTNLLIMDEIFDGSLDASGIDYFMVLLDQLKENTNVFIITHKSDVFADKFSKIIKFELKNDFSQIVEGNNER